jgi:ArsR family transcriptional regulator
MDSPLRQFKARVFQALAHPTRIAVIDALRGGERTAGALQTALGVEQANLSQHLAVLRANGLVATRRAGNQIFYEIRDPVLTKVLDLLKRYFYSHLTETQDMLREIRHEGARR